jgi:hypothetical protein
MFICVVVFVIIMMSKWQTNEHDEGNCYLCIQFVIGFRKNIRHNFAGSKSLRNFAKVYHFNTVNAFLY